jgi:hypothetical protein
MQERLQSPRENSLSKSDKRKETAPSVERVMMEPLQPNGNLIQYNIEANPQGAGFCPMGYVGG